MAVAAPLSPHPGSWRTLVVPGVAVAYGLVVLALLPADEPLVTTYGAASQAAGVAGQVAGLTVLAVGAWAATQHSPREAGPLMVAAGVLWFAPDWVGWEDGPGVLRTLGTVATPFLVLALLHFLVVLLDRRAPRGVLPAAYAATALLSTGYVLLGDPFLDPDCWRNCSDNVFLLSSRPTAASWASTALAVVQVLLAAGAAGVAVGELTRGSSVARRRNGPLFGAVVLVGSTEAAYGISVLVRAESAQDRFFVGLYVARAVGWALLASAMVLTLILHRRRRAALSALSANLDSSPRPGSLETALRAATGDADLAVHYPVGTSGRHVTAAGLPAADEDAPGRATATLRRGEATVAVLRHDPDLLPQQALEEVLGPAARLALENERLAAEQLARLHELRESRARIVQAGDSARRAIERDLHDGAQQRLLALSYLIRLAAAEADRTGQRVAASRLAAAAAEAQAALADLRQLAHGIHPAVLTETGLPGALRSLADRAEVVVVIEEVTADRLPPSVELAAYTAVRTAVGQAADHGVDEVNVRASRADGVLTVRVSGAGLGEAGDLDDRVGALGGRVVRTSDATVVELPCGW